MSSLIEAAPSVIMMLSPDHQILEFNPEAERLYGKKRKDVLGKNYLEMFLPEEARDMVAQDIEKVLDGESTRGFENAVRAYDGTKRILSWNVNGILDSEGQPIGIVTVGQDITDRKKADESLRESEMTVRAFLNATTDSALLIDREGLIIDLNDNMVRRLGRNRSDMIGTIIYDYLPPDLAEQRKAIGFEAASTKKPIRFEDQRENSWFENSVYPILDPKGQVDRFAIFSRDITESKRAEEALHASEAKYRALFEATGDAIFAMEVGDSGPCFVECSSSTLKMFGCSREDIIGKSPVDFSPPVQPDGSSSAQRVREIAEAAMAGEPQFFVWTNCRLDGTEFDTEVTVNRVDLEGRAYLQAIVRDITKRKNAVQALRESEERLKILFESAPDAIYLNDLKGNFVNGNKAAEEMVGYPKEELTGKSFLKLNLLPSYQVPKAAVALAKNAMGKPTGPDEFTLQRKDGSNVAVEIRTFPVRIGNQTLSLGIARDVTERKKAEKELQESEERFRSLSNAAFEGIAITERGRIIDANATFTNLFGYHFDEIIGKEVGILVAPEDRKLVAERIQSGYEKPYEHKALRKDGSVLDIEVCGRSILYKARKCRITAIRDITEYKRARETLRENEMRFRQLVENIREVFWMENADGTELLYVSPAYEEIWGRSCEEFYKNPRVWIDAIHPDDRQHVEDAFAKGRLDGTYSEEFRIIRSDGTMRWIWDRNVVIRDEFGNTQRIAGVAEDITERKKAQQKFLEYQTQLKSLASELLLAEERERRRIATGVHDDIGQKLALTKLELQSIPERVSDPDVSASLSHACELVDKAMQDARSLAFDLSNPVLYKVGFVAAVESLLSERIMQKCGIKSEFKSKVRKLKLGQDTSVVMFQAVRELLTNVVKHANASTVKVCIDKSDHKVQVIVEDDGIGFDLSRLKSPDKEKGEFGLFNVKERLEYLGGSFDIESKPGQGTRVTMTVPLKPGVMASQKEMSG